MQTARTPQAAGRGGWRKLSLGLLPLLLVSGCQTAAGTGALTGAAGGGAIGNMIAKSTGGSRTAGTILGAGLGTIAGTVVGDKVDRDKERARVQGAADAQAAMAPTAQAPTLAQVVDMTNKSVPTEAIITQIRNSRAAYSLSPDDLNYLSTNHVHPAVIREMQAPAGPAVIYQQPVRIIEQRPVYVHQPPPVGFGVTYSRGYR